MAYPQASWIGEPPNRFGLDPIQPIRPQVVANLTCLAVILGGSALGLVAIKYYPPLVLDRTIYIVGILGIAPFFAASYAVIRPADLPPGIPLAAALMFRAGVGLGMMFLLLGVGGIANGWATPRLTRDVPALAKRETRHRDPARRTYYVAVRAWPGSQEVVELGMPARATSDSPCRSCPSIRRSLFLSACRIAGACG